MTTYLRRVLISAAALAVITIGCSRKHESGDFLPTSPEVRDALQILLSAASMPADGFSKITIVAQVDPEADFRTVVFETDLGTLLGADTNSSNRVKTVEADVTGRAEAQLKSEPTVGRATLTVEVRGTAETGGAVETLISKTVFVEFTRPGPGTLEVTLSEPALPADGFSFVELIARVAADAPNELRDILFETTLGRFEGSTAADGRTLERTADLDGVAVARLTSDAARTTGVAEVTVSLKNLDEVVQRRLVEFLSVDQEFIELTLSATSIPADGFSEIELSARIAADTPPALKKVTFTATGGSFLGAPAASPRKVDVDAGLDGVAVARLISDTDPGTVEVRAFRSDLPSAAATAFVDFEPVVPSEIITLTTSSSTAPADGFTRTDLIAQISPDLEGNNRQVTFGRTLGTLSATTVVADASNRAVVQVTSATAVGVDRLTATVNASGGNTPVTAEATLQYTRALPDSITLKPASVVMAASSDSLRFTAQLDRISGSVTEGTTVDYVIRKQSDGSLLDLVFQSVTLSDSNGESEATLARGGSAFTGFAVVTASVPGSAASDQVVIEIQ